MPATASFRNELMLETAEDFSSAVKTAFGADFTYNDLDNLTLGELFEKATQSLPQTGPYHTKNATMMAFYTIRRVITDQTGMRTPRALKPSTRLAQLNSLKPKSVQKRLKGQYFNAQPFVWSDKGYRWAWRMTTVLFWLLCLPLMIVLLMTEHNWETAARPLFSLLFMYVMVFVPIGWVINQFSSGHFACSRLGALAKQHLALNYKSFLNRGARFERREAWEAFTHLAQCYAYDYREPLDQQTRIIY